MSWFRLFPSRNPFQPRKTLNHTDTRSPVNIEHSTELRCGSSVKNPADTVAARFWLFSALAESDSAGYNGLEGTMSRSAYYAG